MESHIAQSIFQPLPIVVISIGLLVVCGLVLLGLVVADRIAEHRLGAFHAQSLELSVDSLITELTAI